MTTVGDLAVDLGLGSSHSLLELGWSDASQWETLYPVSNSSQAAEDHDATLPPLQSLLIQARLGQQHS